MSAHFAAAAAANADIAALLTALCTLLVQVTASRGTAGHLACNMLLTPVHPVTGYSINTRHDN